MWQQDAPEEDEDYNFDQEYPAEVLLRIDKTLIESGVLYR